MGMFFHSDDDNQSVSDQVSNLESRLECTEKELFDIKNQLVKYLSYPSCDGNRERQNLRRELCKLLNRNYSESSHTIS